MCHIYQVQGHLEVSKVEYHLTLYRKTSRSCDMEAECWFMSRSRLHLPLQLSPSSTPWYGCLCHIVCQTPAKHISLFAMCLDESREMILMHHHSSHLCHTLLKSPYCWLLCALHQESRVNPISNERRLLCISIVHRSEEQTLELDTLCGIYLSFHFSTSNKLFNKLPLPLYRQFSIHHGHWSWESREWISIQSNHITLLNASSNCWLLFAPQKRESQYIQDGSVHHATQRVSYFFEVNDSYLCSEIDTFNTKSTIFSVASARKVWLNQAICQDNHLSWPEGVLYPLIHLHSHMPSTSGLA